MGFGILGQQQLELLTGAMDAMDAMDASFQAQTVATHALQNTGPRGLAPTLH